VNDSPATSAALQTERAARWLEANGVLVARNAAGDPDAVIEIKQTTAICPDDLKSVKLPGAVNEGDEVLL